MYFKNEKEMMLHLINGGAIRPHFIADKDRIDNWIVMRNGNRVKLKTGESAQNFLLGVDYWVAARKNE